LKGLLTGVHEAIGGTPLTSLSRLCAQYNVSGNIYAKLEYLNPGFSKKDRIALQIIEEAEASGALKPGQPVVELTSGNTGTGLAIVCNAKGHKFYACMSGGNSMERARMMRALGAEVILVPQLPGSVPGEVSGGDLALVEQKARQLTEELNAFRADQFTLEANVRAHENHTAVEIIEQCGGRLNAFADFMGTGGSFEGCARAFKRYDNNIRCYAVEPETAAYFSGKPVGDGAHKIQGGGYSMELPLVNPKHFDGIITISDRDAIDTARALARYEGIFAGFSSGANVYAAIKLLEGREAGGNIAVIINDSGLKYLSTELY
jgi:cysteine synthase A